MKKASYLLLLVAMASFLSCTTLKSDNYVHPKREFRGAWIQAVNQQFTGMSEQQMKGYLVDMLNNLAKVHVNTVIFQVRVEGDALYSSTYEPWSRFITGEQGCSPGWDPLAFMVDECHKRNMELHAWINPYRARTKGTTYVSPEHMSVKHPGRFVEYLGQLYFNPALQINREHICKVVRDILTHYDVDGIHMDDYFYPYPTRGVDFPDNRWFEMSGSNDKAEWRRENVNHLIYQLHRTIDEVKPWVKFGVSPFGIYRNKNSWEHGSRTNGLQCYDDLNADVLLWINKGWVDYCIPQIYWEIGHPAADYEELVGWWARHAAKRPLFIGQDVVRTVNAKDTASVTGNQQQRKYELQRSTPKVSGSCFWDAASVANNLDGYRDFLAADYYRYPALVPSAPFIDNRAPVSLRAVKAVKDELGTMLLWVPADGDGLSEMDKPCRYVVYCFAKDEKIDLNDPSKIVQISAREFYRIPSDVRGEYIYVVTVLDRLQNESKGTKCKVAL